MGRAHRQIASFEGLLSLRFYPRTPNSPNSAFDGLVRSRLAYSLPQNSLLKCLDNQSWSSEVLMAGVPIIRGFDANKERNGAGHNRYFMVPFGGKTTRFRGPRVITVYPAVPFGGEPPVRGHGIHVFYDDLLEVFCRRSIVSASNPPFHQSRIGKEEAGGREIVKASKDRGGGDGIGVGEVGGRQWRWGSAGFRVRRDAESGRGEVSGEACDASAPFARIEATVAGFTQKFRDEKRSQRDIWTGSAPNQYVCGISCGISGSLRSNEKHVLKI
ncbi:hypothetical protein KFK09_014943 [Dendrobium nobile]|uniref:Uncharacterized protein n=1 Tax=Dendrobium nobile TaxID=94219 RepID=A0A8T3B992_DENNO|nr:hypothetical protein KFK09_014943 [Dendrobium nobile]